VEPWLPQPPDWKGHTVAVQAADKDSVLSLYRAALALRRTDLATLPEELHWLEAGDQVIAFRRGDRFACLVNFSASPLALPAGATVLLASNPPVDGWLPSDTTAWLDLAGR